MNSNQQAINLMALKKHFESMSDEEREREAEKITHAKFKHRWIEKFHRMYPYERKEIILKIIQKYSSKEYRNRESKCGYEPRETLFGLLYEYAKVYGEQIPDNLENEFIEDAFIIDKMFYISVTFGQGCFYTCYELRCDYNQIMHNITESLLRANNFKYKDFYGVPSYTKEVDNVFIEVGAMSNMFGREWYVHIDNQDRDSIARVDIQTIEHFNKLMELMDINFKMGINYGN